MDVLTRAMTGAMRVAVHVLPDGRRDWAEAVLAEADDVPAGRARRSWLIGGLWLVLRQAPAVRRFGILLAAAVAGVLVVWLDWHPGSANPAVPTNRLATITAVTTLAVLPFVVRAVLGPVADHRIARMVRTGGYLGVYALLFVLAGLSRFAGSRFDHFEAFDQRNWEADVRDGAVVAAVLVIGVTGVYALAVLGLTARRTLVAPSTLTAGVLAGAGAAVLGYALMPFGNPLRPDNGLLAFGYNVVLPVIVLGAPLAAGLVAARGPAAGLVAARGPARRWLGRVGRGSVAGLLAGGTAAVGITVLTLSTMLLMPGHVALRWANPDPSAAHGTPFEVQMSVGDAAGKYQLALLAWPLLGMLLGAVAVTRQATPSGRHPVG